MFLIFIKIIFLDVQYNIILDIKLDTLFHHVYIIKKSDYFVKV